MAKPGNEIKQILKTIKEKSAMYPTLCSPLLVNNGSAILSLIKESKLTPKQIINADLEWHGSGDFKKAYRLTFRTKEGSSKDIAILVGIDQDPFEFDYEIVKEEFKTLLEMHNSRTISKYFPKPILFLEHPGASEDISTIIYFDEFIKGENIGSFIKGKKEKELKELANLEGFMTGKIYEKTGKFLKDPKGDNIKVVRGKETELKIVDVGFMNILDPTYIIQTYLRYNESDYYYKQTLGEKIRKRKAVQDFSRPEVIGNPKHFIRGLKAGMGQSKYDVFVKLYEYCINKRQGEKSKEVKEFLGDTLALLNKLTSKREIDINHKMHELAKKQHPWYLYSYHK